MGSTDTAAPAKPDPKEVQFASMKEAFEEAKRRTALEAGEKAAPKPDGAKPEAAPEPEKAEKPAEEAPKPKKPKAPKATPAPTPDPVLAQLKALEDKIAALTAPKPPEPEPQEDPLDAIRGELAERFGEDEAGALVKALEALHAPAAQRIAQLEKIIQEATTQGRKNVAKSNRARLAADYPHLKESNDAWEMLNSLVVASFEKDPKKYASVEEAYDDVATKLYGSLKAQEDVESEEESSEEEDVEEVASRIAASALTPPANAPKRERRSQMDKRREHFAYLQKHPGDKAGAARLARELGIDR